MKSKDWFAFTLLGLVWGSSFLWIKIAVAEVGPFLLYFYLLHSVGPTRTVLVTYVFPLVGVALGVIFLHEPLNWYLLLGGAFIIGSIIIVNRKTSPGNDSLPTLGFGKAAQLQRK